MRSSYRRIGDYIDLVDERNKDLSVDLLLGLSISKEFIPSVANTVGSDMANYKIIRKGQFACSIMQVRRDKKIPVALLEDHEIGIISQAYPVFKIKDENELLPQYLMMWFSRPEFDREACFYAVGGVRGSLEWEDFCNMQLPIPSIEKQREIVAEYNTVVNRIKLNERLNQKLEETAQAIYRRWFVEFEFPISKEQAAEMGQPELQGKSYKSSGGSMFWSEELGKEVPEGWEAKKLRGIMRYSSDRIDVVTLSLETYISTENMMQNRAGVTIASTLPSAKSVTNFKVDDILISNIRPYFKKIWHADFEGGCSNDVLCLSAYDSISPQFAYFTLENDSFFDYVMQGAKGTKMPRGDKKWIMKYPVMVPDEKTLSIFEDVASCLSERRKIGKLENIRLGVLSEVLLSKMTKVEREKERDNKIISIDPTTKQSSFVQFFN